MQAEHENITLAETPLNTKITNTQQKLWSCAENHLQQFAESDIKKSALYHDINLFITNALNCFYQNGEYSAAETLIYLSSACEGILALGSLYCNQALVTLGKQLRVGIQNHLAANQALFDQYLSATVATTMTAKQKSDRRLTTGIRYSTSSMSVASIADPIVAPFANHKETRDHLRQANESFREYFINIRLPHHVSRFRLNTEHGQSINVFRAELFKIDANQEPLYVIAVHGNASCASGELPNRMREAEAFLLNSNAGRVILLTPDLPGSVASGGYAKSLGEISQNSVQKLVKHLIQQGVDPSQIVVRGHSLGGLIATHAVHTLKSENIEVSLISVDSLAQTQKFLPKGLAPIAGQLALKHFDAPAYKFFEALAPNRRFCIHKVGDKVIPPSCSVMFHLEGNAILADQHQVTREDCFLIQDPAMDHNNDVVQLENNPCLTAFARFYHDRMAFQEAVFNQFCEKAAAGIRTFDTYIAKYTKCIKIGQALMAELPALIEQLRQSLQPITERLQILLGWIIHHNNQQFVEYQREAQQRVIHKDAPFLDFCQAMAKFAQSYPTINQLMQNKESKAHCIALYQASLVPPQAKDASELNKHDM